METSSKEYQDHLENKYLPFRYQYLKWLFFPKILRQFSSKEIVDLGCGTGDFLKFLTDKNRKCSGIDNNPFLVEKCVKLGYQVRLDDVTKLESLTSLIDNAVLDNVLEHLELTQIESFFHALSARIKDGGVVVIIVPDKKGYTYDPTHKTFVNHEIIAQMCGKYNFILNRSFRHPFNSEAIGRVLYLNMQVFTLKFQSSK